VTTTAAAAPLPDVGGYRLDDGRGGSFRFSVLVEEEWRTRLGVARLRGDPGRQFTDEFCALAIP
jgi:hypothetical protein